MTLHSPNLATRRRAGGMALGVMVLLGAGACKPTPAPVARLEVRPAQLELAWPRYAELEFELEPTAALPPGVERPILFVHLLDEPGSVVRTFDHELPAAWKPGVTIRYRRRLFQSALASPIPAGRYLLSVGLYDLERGRFALAAAGPEVAKLEYQVATVDVPATTAGGPEARFSGEWLTPEATPDRQVVGARRLRGGASGRIGFGPLAGPGTIHLGFTVPGSGGGTRLDVTGDDRQPIVKVNSTCGGAQTELSGTGRFDIDLAVPAGAAEVSCEIAIEPNFVVRMGESSEATSVRLEELSWRPGDVAEP